MKKKILLLAVLIVIQPTAQAETGISIYGLIDDGIASIQHSLPASSVNQYGLNPFNITSANQGTYTGIVSGGASASRFGIDGKYDVDSQTTAFFLLESSINTASMRLGNNGQSIFDNNQTAAAGLNTASERASSVNGQYFANAAYIGMSHFEWGSIKIGRNTALALDQVQQFDPLHASALYSPLGTGAIGGGLGVSENNRLDNSIKYENKVGDFRIALEYKLGQSGDTDASNLGTVFEASVGYKNGPFDSQVTYGRSIDTAGLKYKLFASGAANTQLLIQDTWGYLATVKYTVNQRARLMAGFENTFQSAPDLMIPTSQITSYYGMGIPTGVGIGYWPSNSASGSGTLNTTSLWFGGSYQLNRGLSVDAAYYRINNGAYYTGTSVTPAYDIQAFSAMVDYQFEKVLALGPISVKSDVYAAVMNLNYDGAYLAKYASAHLETNNTIIGVGYRARF